MCLLFVSFAECGICVLTLVKFSIVAECGIAEKANAEKHLAF